jgi:hypothetical protein
LRCPAQCRRLVTVFHHVYLEPLPDQLQDPAVTDLARDEVQQDRVIDTAEEVLDVGVEHVVVATIRLHPELLERLRRRATGPEPIRAVFETDLEDRL